MAVLTHGSLFSGIGGFDLAAEWMGWENKFHCEWNEFGQRVLHHYWPNAEQFIDITKSDFTKYANKIDILTGGFPCQPYSLAGKRKGKEDERHLWPEMLRAIREIQPRWVVGENVFGLINWNGGMVFNEVQSDLEAEGYEVWPYVLPACAVNAPHRRDRVWFVAYANSNGQQRSNSEYEVNASEGGFDALNDIEQTIMHSNGTSEQRQHVRQQRKGKSNRPGCGNEIDQWQNFPTQSPICSGDDGLPNNTYRETVYNENRMDRDIVIKGTLDKGYLFVDFTTGKVFSTRSRNRFLNGTAHELPGCLCNGYKVHTIYFEGIKKQCRAHQIVWIAANGLYDKSKYMIDHIDRNKENNALSNLRLVDAKGNRENATEYTGRLTQEDKDRLYFLYTEGDMSIRELSEDFGISKSRVHQLLQEHSGLDGITFSKWRNESIKAAGNAIVPQVALQIFKAIEEHENLTINKPNLTT